MVFLRPEQVKNHAPLATQPHAQLAAKAVDIIEAGHPARLTGLGVVIHLLSRSTRSH
jgi:hypothetical protein